MAEKNSVAIADALAALAAGEAIVYPTETFYALGVDALSVPALDRLFAIKGREPGKPVALIAADTAMAFAVAREVPAEARVLAQAFWPGPLTLVLPARAEIPAPLVGADGGVGVRVSSHPIARALAAGLRSPLTATSANLAGEPPASEIEMARRAFPGTIKVFVDVERSPGVRRAPSLPWIAAVYACCAPERSPSASWPPHLRAAYRNEA